MNDFFINIVEMPEIQSEHLLLPAGVPFGQKDLGVLLEFYNIINRAKQDKLERVLIVNQPFSKTFHKVISEFCGHLPADWDIVYFKYDSVSLRSPIHPKTRDIYKVNYATGIDCIGINNRFYHLFLEDARVPRATLDEHIRSLSIASNIYCVIPSL